MSGNYREHRGVDKMNIPQHLKGPIIDFINEADKIPNLKYIILFGSVPKGEVSKKSDIDLLMLFQTDHNPEVGKEMDICLDISSKISQKHKLAYSFSFVMKNLNDPEDIETDFLWNVSKEGTIIWGRLDIELIKKPSTSLQPKSLIIYFTKGLATKEKSAIQRGLFGYKFSQRIKDKLYHSQKNGLINKKEFKLSKGVLLIPSTMEEAVIAILKNNRAKYELLKIWG